MADPLFESKSDVAVFSQRLATRALGKHIAYEERVASTNDLALAAARGDGAHGTVFVAESQDAGRGRLGRKWEAPPRLALLFSVLVRPQNIPPSAAGWIPLLAGFSCVEALNSIVPELSLVTVKWPNDIVMPYDALPGWKKLGGVLCESALPALVNDSRQNPADAGYCVIGIGLNINQTAAMLPQTGIAPPSSLLVEAGRTNDRTLVLQRVLERIEANLDRLTQSQSRTALFADIETKMRAWLSPEKKFELLFSTH